MVTGWPARRLLPDAGLWKIVASLLLAARPAAGQSSGPIYSILNPGSRCSDYKIDDVPSEAICFNQAQTQAGLAGKTTLRLDGVGFTGCVYNIDADILMYGVSTETVALSSWQYICDGVPTTTTTTTTTQTTVVTTTLTTIAPEDIYSLIEYYQNCAYYKLPDVSNVTECFDKARHFVGLSASTTLQLDGLGFTGCVFNDQAGGPDGVVIYGETFGVSGAITGTSRYICKGLATTTTTTTATTTTTVTTTTTTTSTTTVTTTTETSSTSTVTTSTATTSTETSSTSTRTTITITGSSSTTTTSTTSATSTTTATTSTASTSTATTRTTTYSEGAGFVGDDPLTLFGDVTKQFFLPDRGLVELLSTPELRLMGSAVGYGAEQWINHLEVTGPQGEPVLRVAIRNDIAAYNPEEAPAEDFATLNVTLDWLDGLALRAMPPPEAYAYTWRSLVFAFGRLPHFKVGRAPAEVVIVEGKTARVVITSVAAGSFQGDQAHLAAKYAHLDFVLHVKQKDVCEGVLPELWGLRPLSDGTLAMLEQKH